MKRTEVHILILISMITTSCIFTIGWDEFKSENIVSDFYLTSMNDDYHVLVLKDDENDNSGIVIVPSNVVKIGSSERFIAAVSCCDWIRENQDTTYYIVDLRKYNDVSWFQKLFSTHSEKLEEYQFENEVEFHNTLDSLTQNQRINLKEIK